METFWLAWMAAFASFVTQLLTTPFFPVVVVASAAALAAFVGAVRRIVWERGWNTRPPPHTATLEALCVVAFLATIISATAAWSIHASAESVRAAFNVAHTTLFPRANENTREGGWRRATFVRITEEVHNRRLEDLTALLRPVDGGTEIPLTNAETARLFVNHYVSEVDRRFLSGELGLPGLLWSRVIPQGGWPASAAESVSISTPTAATADFARLSFLREAVEGRITQLQHTFLETMPSRVPRWPLLAPAILLQLLAWLATARAAWRDLRVSF